MVPPHSSDTNDDINWSPWGLEKVQGCVENTAQIFSRLFQNDNGTIRNTQEHPRSFQSLSNNWVQGPKLRTDTEYESSVIQHLIMCQNIPTLWHNEFNSMKASPFINIHTFMEKLQVLPLPKNTHPQTGSIPQPGNLLSMTWYQISSLFDAYSAGKY